MMRKEGQDGPMPILTPIPDPWLVSAATLWCRHFAPRSDPGQARADQGLVALCDTGPVGVMGLRDHRGGFVAQANARVPGFRPAPATSDLVIDGIVITRPRQGVGRALIAVGLRVAIARERPGLRAEVRLANAAALAFYRDLGFVEVTRGRYGWPWTGQVVVLRRPCTA